MKLMYIEKPQLGQKFCALYNDGSGARLYMIDDSGEMHSSEGELENIEYLDNFSHWFAIPDSYKFWMEK